MKQTDKKCNPLTYWGGLKKNEQEILEEAAENYAEGKSSSLVFQEAYKRGFINGAKWQQERSYSEEDMHSLMDEYQGWLVNTTFETVLTFRDWFETIKNK